MRQCQYGSSPLRDGLDLRFGEPFDDSASKIKEAITQRRAPLSCSSCAFPKLIVLEPGSLVVPEGDIHEELHGHDRTRNDSAFIDLGAVEV